MPRTSLSSAVFAAVLGCSTHSAHRPTETPTVPIASLFGTILPALDSQRAELNGFVEVSAESRQPVDRDELEAFALAGTVDNPTEQLGSRLQIRPVRVPKPPRGSTSLFNIEGSQRGWVTQLPGGDQLPTPAYADGKVFVSGGFASRYFFAFDAFTGDSKWSLRAPDGGPSSAIIEDKKVIFNAESCVLFVADAETGKIIWQRWLGDPLMSVPVASDGKVMTAYPKANGHQFAAFALADGKPAWSVSIPNDVIRAPQIAGGSVFFATFDGTAHRLRVSDGKVEWKRDIGATSAMWVHGDRVLVARKSGTGKKAREQTVVLSADTGKVVDQGDDFAAPYLAGTSRDRRLLHAQQGAWGSVRDSDHLGLRNVAAGWAYQGSSPSVAAGIAYFAVGGEIRAADIATGKTLWRRTIKDGADAQSISPPAVVGSQLVYGTIDGHLLFSDIDTGMAIRAYDVGEPLLQQPIVAQGWVYLTTASGRLIALELADPKFDGWHMWAGNSQHNGPVATAGQLDPALAASLERPDRGTLRADGADLPLVSTKVDANVSGFVARVKLHQTFENPGDKPLEATYLFPLPADAAVDDMTMRVGDRVIEAKIARKAAAKKTYEAAKKSGKKAALLEQQRPNVFAQRVANIPPKSSIEIDIQYVHWLPLSDSTYQYLFPMADGDDVDLIVTLDAGMPIEHIESRTHSVDIARHGDRAVVKMGKADAGGGDFALQYSVAGELPRAAVLAHRGSDDGYFSLIVQPPAAPADDMIAPRELVFVVDTSASMAGLPSEQATSVVASARERLRPDDTMRVVEVADPAAMADTLKAELASLTGEDGRTPILVLISDGYIANEADVLRAIVAELDDARVFALGVGSAHNLLLLERAAEVGRGRSHIAMLSDPADHVAAEFMALIDRPVLTDIAIDWGDLTVSDVYPRRIPDVFAGSPVVVRGRFSDGGSAVVKVRGTIGNKRYERAMHIELPTEPGLDHAAQRTVWARAAIRDRLRRLMLRDDAALIEEVTELGLAHRQVTPYTSLVAVEGVADESASPTKATVSPARALPGDPEIRIPAPRDARQVSVVLPFGETVEAEWESALGLWTARFLIPSDASDGGHPIDILITTADGATEHMQIWYTVDSAAPLVDIEVIGDARPGNRVTLRARQTITDADLAQSTATRATLTDARVQLLSDAKRVTVRLPDSSVLPLVVSGPGRWEADYDIPADAAGRIELEVVVVDLAANVRTQTLSIEVAQ